MENSNIERPDPADDDGRSASNRRRFLNGLGALSVVGRADSDGDGDTFKKNS